MQLELLLEESHAPMMADAEGALAGMAEEKSAAAFKTISEAAEFLGVPQHVLRFWENKFKQIRPLKLRGGRRYYRPEDMETLVAVKNLLYKQGYTIKGARKALAVARSADEPVEKIHVTHPPAANDSRIQALATIRQELINLREALKPHIF